MTNAFLYGITDGLDDTYLLTTKTAFGESGHNTGNFAFVHAINKVLGGGQPVFSWEEDVGVLNATRSTGVIPCANQLGPHANYGKLGERFNQLTIPLVAIGLGAQAGSSYDDIPVVPNGTLDWVRSIVSKSRTGAPNIGVRGPFTLKVLEHYGLGEHAVVTGCPSLFLNPNKGLGARIAKRAENPFARIAVAAGHQGWKHLGQIEASLVRLMEQTDGAYIVQSPIEMAMLARGESHLVSEIELANCRDYIKPGMEIEDFKAWTRKYFRVFFGASEWMEFLSGFDFVVGARIHGVILALQAGVPGLCIAHDSRTREMCEVLKVPFVMAREVIKEGFTMDTLRSWFNFDADAFDDNRRELSAGLNKFLIANELNESLWLKQISSS